MIQQVNQKWFLCFFFVPKASAVLELYIFFHFNLRDILLYPVIVDIVPGLVTRIGYCR